MSTSNGRPIRQACAIPYRFRDGELEFCLITSRKGLWSFPKGIIEPGDTPQQTARKEALEEAGLRGRVGRACLGRFRYAKWGTRPQVEVFLMQVTGEEDRWEESAWRVRKWCRAPQALRCLARKPLRELLGVALERLDASRRQRAG